jgi:hypothetical protein
VDIWEEELALQGWHPGGSFQLEKVIQLVRL